MGGARHGPAPGGARGFGGDAGHPAPYADVGPWTPRTGGFWNASFGRPAPRRARSSSQGAGGLRGRYAVCEVSSHPRRDGRQVDAQREDGSRPAVQLDRGVELVGVDLGPGRPLTSSSRVTASHIGGAPQR